MPTGTSTILGVFQAILALLSNRTNFVLFNNLVSFEKFASEIFGRNPMCCYVAARKELTVLCEPMSNQRQINGFKMVRLIRVTGCGATHNGEFRIKNA
jgi:hypothetical protein